MSTVRAAALRLAAWVRLRSPPNCKRPPTATLVRLVVPRLVLLAGSNCKAASPLLLRLRLVACRRRGAVLAPRADAVRLRLGAERMALASLRPTCWPGAVMLMLVRAVKLARLVGPALVRLIVPPEPKLLPVAMAKPPLPRLSVPSAPTVRGPPRPRAVAASLLRLRLLPELTACRGALPLPVLQPLTCRRRSPVVLSCTRVGATTSRSALVRPAASPVAAVSAVVWVSLLRRLTARLPLPAVRLTPTPLSRLADSPLLVSLRVPPARRLMAAWGASSRLMPMAPLALMAMGPLALLLIVVPSAWPRLPPCRSIATPFALIDWVRARLPPLAFRIRPPLPTVIAPALRPAPAAGVPSVGP